MSLLTLRNITLGFGGEPLLNQANLIIEPGERIGLIGRNGTGKSTLLKLINSEIAADAGDIERQPGLTTAKLIQDIPQNFSGSVFSVVASGLGDVGYLLTEYDKITHELATHSNAKLLDQLQKVQQKLETIDGWKLEQQVKSILSKMDLDPDLDVNTLSGGLIRRVLLAKALVLNPDILLLDEPTNHLDIAAIIWLEKFLLNYNKTLLFITHDRALLQNVANRMIEIDNGQLYSWSGHYLDYLKHKEERLAAEQTAQKHFDKKLAEEERWIRQGIKARRTRNEGRVRALEKMREQRKQRRMRPGQVKFKTQAVDASGKIIFDVENISYQYDENKIITGFSTTIMRGDKVGIIGPNGCGKSTLLQLLLNELKPQLGIIKQGTSLSIGYFDQRHRNLDENKSVQENVYAGGEQIQFEGKTIHVLSYLRDFLFEPESARMPVRVLSGGERNRLLLARLFTQPHNVLVLDEPTNDLDMETLELLEEKLIDYPGTLLLVSHDREFLNNVVTSTIVFEGDGELNEYIGGYDDYLRQRRVPAQRNPIVEKSVPEKVASKVAAVKKLSYKEQRELAQLPEYIEKLEQEQQLLHEQMAQPNFYRKSAEEIAQVSLRIQTIEHELAQAYQRWEHLS